MPAHRVVVIGAGFGGVSFVQAFRGTGAEITLVDRRNHHLFQPLLYQVATAILSPADIAWPIRRLFRDRADVTTLMAEVTGIDTTARQVALAGGRTLPYDSLVIATGATHSYFGHDAWRPFAPPLKTIEDALEVRGRILGAFERAELTDDAQERAALLTFAVIGGGPTGVELAGMIADIRNGPLARDFRRIDAREARVFLLEGGPRILAAFPEDLGARAARALTRRGIEVRTGTPVTACGADHFTLGAQRVDCRTILWAAGVHASPAAEWLGAGADRAGRVIVTERLEVPGQAEVFVVGDTALVQRPDGHPVPGLAPAAKQQGKYVARLLARRLRGAGDLAPFAYRDQGSLATIGKWSAVIAFGRIRLSGWVAWWIWGIAHIFFLIGTRSRFSVAWNWFWTHFRGQGSARLITGDARSSDMREDG